MKRRLYSRATFVVCVLILCAAAVAILGRHARANQSQCVQDARLQLRSATPSRIDKLGNGEADRSGLVTPDTEEYSNRAFPNAGIAFAQTHTAMKDAKKVLKHTGAKIPKPWEAIGPDTLNVFDVHYNPVAGTATWTDITGDLGDQPILDGAYDAATGDIYVSTDFGVNRLAAGTSTWIPAADGLPPVAVYGLTLTPGGKKTTDRVLYAATHSRGAYRIQLPKAK